MCRNIKPLFNFAPPATDEEVRAAAVQFVRKLSGCTKPSKTNEAAFERAVDQVAVVARELIDSLVTTAPPKDRATEAAAARLRSAKRFGVPAHRVTRAAAMPHGQTRPRKPRSSG
jgi:hypothetical protein